MHGFRADEQQNYQSGAMSSYNSLTQLSPTKTVIKGGYTTNFNKSSNLLKVADSNQSGNEFLLDEKTPKF